MLISDQDYLILAFLSAEEERRFQECYVNETDPLVGLITTGRKGAAFRVEKAKCVVVRSCTVTDSFALSLGPDSTILLEDHHQEIQTVDSGAVCYTVPLAYIVSYGDEINCMTIYKYLDSLVCYSTNLWAEGAGVTLSLESTEKYIGSSRFLRMRN